MSNKIRLDLHILTQGLVNSRHQAQQLIRAGKVRDLFGKVLDKPGLEVDKELVVSVQSPPRFVSRGGEKLISAIETFSIELTGKVCLDGGISTGGFTDCLLQKGAVKVYGIDVGYGQLAWSLRTDPRVVLRERTNLRTLTPEQLYECNDPFPTFAVADLSFISLKLVLPAIKSLLSKDNPEALVLVKPQFEVGRDLVGKGGVVKDASAHIQALHSVIQTASSLGFLTKGINPSPITGPAGNHEYLLWLGTKTSDFKEIDLAKTVKDTLS